jgi:peptidoglycan-associated lipoprotein
MKVQTIILGVALFLAGCAYIPSNVRVLNAGSPACICDDFVDNVDDRVFYDFDKFALSSDAEVTLGHQAAWLTKRRSLNVLIAGNADERGTETYNLALGERRADAARDYLLAQGITASRIKTISYGKDCPVAAGNNEASYQENRNAITSVHGHNPQTCP